jgi:hypothetical protein
MSEEAVVSVGAFLILFDEVAHLRMIIVSISFSVFGIVIVHAMFVVMSLGDIAGSHFKDFQVQMLNILSLTLTIGAM